MKHDVPLPVGGALERWLAGRPAGATIPVTTLCDLATAGGMTAWRPIGAANDGAEPGDLEACGLVDEFWQLA